MKDRLHLHENELSDKWIPQKWCNQKNYEIKSTPLAVSCLEDKDINNGVAKEPKSEFRESNKDSKPESIRELFVVHEVYQAYTLNDQESQSEQEHYRENDGGGHSEKNGKTTSKHLDPQQEQKIGSCMSFSGKSINHIAYSLKLNLLVYTNIFGHFSIFS